eukprot:TRINITY_DN105906_c0_g1_i1.p1 TRINITY_DN105906_c0_g1~~TRINITY_DN105906_c0_g1_i1.p1  ORF type:complete len:204 (-),score=31.02 TRINITY_DN105906_c0_g1_i1:149-727(-)
MGQTQCYDKCSATAGCSEHISIDVDDDYLDGDLKNSAAMKGHKLLAFARDGDADGVTRMLADDVFVDVRRPFVMTIQTVPVMSGETVLRATGLTPLMYAAQSGYISCCQRLLEAKARADAEDEDGHKPLHFAAASGSFDVCELLVKHDADPNAMTDDDRRAIDFDPAVEMVMRSDRERWIKLLGKPTLRSND